MSKMGQLHHDTAIERADEAEREVARLTAENEELKAEVGRLRGAVKDLEDELDDAMLDEWDNDDRCDDEWGDDGPTGLPGDPCDYPQN